MTDEERTTQELHERSIQQVHEGQQPRHLVKSLFMSHTDYDPFGDQISVVQEPPTAPASLPETHPDAISPEPGPAALTPEGQSEEP
jgi:hypothetical protein